MRFYRSTEDRRSSFSRRNESLPVGLNPRFVAWSIFMRRNWTPWETRLAKDHRARSAVI